MIVFRTYVVLTFMIVILSLKKINASSQTGSFQMDSEQDEPSSTELSYSRMTQDNLSIRETRQTKSIPDVWTNVNSWRNLGSQPIRSAKENCLTRIRFVFPGNDVHAHAIIAINDHDKYTYINGDSKEYYLSFLPYLKKGTIIPVSEFCLNYEKLSPEHCKSILAPIYGYDPYEALIKVFYEYKQNKLGSMTTDVLNTKGELTNVAMDYWDSILNNFGLDTGKHGMPKPEAYCDNLHS